ncbi:MAG: HlyC/CorC family transporter [Flavobacteriales bacterium]|nr:HlyC/CorC family transporter [Flavobacteriales bacterium]
MEILIIALLTLLNSFFSLSEIALVSVKPSRIQALADQGSKRAKTILKLLAEPEAFLSSVQVGITLIGIIAGAYGGAALTGDLETFLLQWPLLMPYAHTVALVLVIGGITYFTIVVGELVPKSIALNSPEKVALFTAPIIRVFTLITFPLVRILSGSTSLILKLLPLDKSQDEPVSEDELRAMLRTANLQGVLEKQETEAHQNLFRFTDQVAKTLMTHTHELDWVDSEKPLAEIIDQVKESRHSKFPVCKGRIEEVWGILSLRDLLDHSREPGFTLQDAVRPPIFIPLSTPAFTIINRFRKHKQYAALVIDEHGSLKGMVTLHDLTEAIIGDLPDDDEDAIPEIVERDDGSYIVGGQVLIGHLNQHTGKLLMDEDTSAYATVGGFFLNRLGHLPVVGDTIQDERFIGEVLDMDGNRIDKVLITVNSDQ